MGALDEMSVVVTGASSGIGEAIARRFVSEGALVVIGSRSEPDVAGTTWLSTVETDLHRGDSLDPAGRTVRFGEYSAGWISTKSSLRPKTLDLLDVFANQDDSAPPASWILGVEHALGS